MRRYPAFCPDPQMSACPSSGWGDVGAIPMIPLRTVEASSRRWSRDSPRIRCARASGRPVVMEDTGPGRHLPVGEGLLTYTDLESAIGCLDAVQRDYARHAAAAREFAHEHLDSDRVLSRILALAGV